MRTLLKEGEEVILELKKHWCIFIYPALSMLIFGTLAVAVFLSSPEIQALGIVFLLIIIPSIFYILYWMIARKYDIWVVTNLRVIDEFGIISHNAKESPLDMINNVSYKKSLLGRLLDYGDVQIQTAASMGAVTVKSVSSPIKLKDTITNCKDQFRKAQMDHQRHTVSQTKTESTQQRNDIKICHYCAELIKKNAIICRYCRKEQ